MVNTNDRDISRQFTWENCKYHIHSDTQVLVAKKPSHVPDEGQKAKRVSRLCRSHTSRGVIKNWSTECFRSELSMIGKINDGTREELIHEMKPPSRSIMYHLAELSHHATELQKTSNFYHKRSSKYTWFN